MGQTSDALLSPNPHYYVILGRAAEIAFAAGSRVGGAEHLFLGMIHDGGWPVTVISRLVDLERAEAAVLSIMNSPGYAPPNGPRVPVPTHYVEPWGADIAVEMSDPYIGASHALLAMIRARHSVPARALAGLADLDVLEAAILDAKNAPAGPPEDAVLLPGGQEMDGPLSEAIIDALPAGSTFGFNTDGQRVWMDVIGPGRSRDREISRAVLNAALASLGRPALDG